MRRELFVLVVVLLAIGGAFVSPVAGATAVEEADEPSLHVAMTANGDATVSLVSVYELADEDERKAFESLEDDEGTQRELLDRFEDRMQSVADGVDDGEATVTRNGIDIRTEDDRGVVTSSVTWEGFAELEGDTLVVTEPFASGFEPDRPLVVTGPDGSAIVSTSHEPAVEADAQVVWKAGTDLNGFELVVSIEPDGSADEAETSEVADETADGLPGFGAVASVAAIAVGLGSLALAGRSRLE